MAEKSWGHGAESTHLSLDDDDTPHSTVDSGLKGGAGGHMKAADEYEPSLAKIKAKAAKQCNNINPKGGAVGRMKATSEEEPAKHREQYILKPRGRLGGYGKTRSFRSTSSMIPEDVNQISGVRSAWSRGWSWAFSNPARIFKHSYHGKAFKETINNDNSNAATSSSAAASAALIEIDRGIVWR